MITEELTSYIEKESEKGIPKETLIKKLRSVGWKEKDLEEAFTVSKKELSETQKNNPVAPLPDLRVYFEPLKKERHDISKLIHEGIPTKRTGRPVIIFLVILLFVLLAIGGVFMYLVLTGVTLPDIERYILNLI